MENEQIMSENPPVEVSTKETLIYEAIPQTGILASIKHYPFVHENTNDLAEFEQNFNRWHTHVLLQKLTWNQTEFGNDFFGKDTESYIIVEAIGVFDNLKSFGRRLQSEINALFPKEAITDKDISVSIIHRESLEIYIKAPSIKFQLIASFIKMNQEAVFEGTNDILKFTNQNNGKQ